MTAIAKDFWRFFVGAGFIPARLGFSHSPPPPLRRSGEDNRPPVSAHQGLQDGLLHVQAVLGLTPDLGLGSLQDLLADLLPAMGGQAV